MANFGTPYHSPSTGGVVSSVFGRIGAIPTNVIGGVLEKYVDGRRTDVYVEDGTPSNPYLNANNAIAAAKAEGAAVTKQYVINVLDFSQTTTPLQLEAYVNVVAKDSSATTLTALTGSTVLPPASGSCDLWNMNFTSNDSVPTFDCSTGTVQSFFCNFINSGSGEGVKVSGAASYWGNSGYASSTGGNAIKFAGTSTGGLVQFSGLGEAITYYDLLTEAGTTVIIAGFIPFNNRVSLGGTISYALKSSLMGYDGGLPLGNTINDAIANLLSYSQAMRLAGVIDCSGNPNCPAATLGDVYTVSVAGKFGGASGLPVDAKDQLVCITTTVAGDWATVGVNWAPIRAKAQNQPLAFPLDGNGYTIEDGLVIPFRTIPFTVTNILGWNLRAIDITGADISDTLTVDIKAATTPGGALASICGGGTKPNLVAQAYNSGSTMTGWTTTMVEGCPWTIEISGTPTAAVAIMLNLSCVTAD